MSTYFVLMCIMSLAAAGYCLLRAVNYIRIIKTGIKCTAKITKFESYRSRGGTYYSPLLKFSDENGQVHLVSSSSGYRDPKAKYEIGQEVTIHYDKNDPEKIAFEKRELVFAIICFVLSLLFPLWVYFQTR